MNQNRRIFWAASHITLRETELPLLLAAGLEVVPEAADAEQLCTPDMLSYDDVAQHPVANTWAQSCTIPGEVQSIVRQSNLVNRQGRLSAAEMALFNEWFDVIYVAGDLNTVGHLVSWFKGVVVFRCFGVSDDIGDFRLTLKEWPANHFSSVLFCPSLEAVAKLPEAQAFGHCHVVHVFRDADDKAKWAGWEKSQDVSLVSHQVTAASFECQVLEQLVPFAFRHFTWLLGKNEIESLPVTMRQAFQVTGYLPKDEYNSRLKHSRLVIHPFANHLHNHYTNIETVVAGIPTLMLRQNPLVNEFVTVENDVETWAKMGVFLNLESLVAHAALVMNDQQMLEQIAENQQALLIPHSRQSVSEEVNILTGVLSQMLQQKVNGIEQLPFLQSSAQERYSQSSRFTVDGGTIDIANLVLSPRYGEVLSEKGGKTAVNLFATDKPLKIPVTNADELLDATKEHGFRLTMQGKIGAYITLVVEIWREGQMVLQDTLSKGVTSESIEGIDFTIQLLNPANVIVYASMVGAPSLNMLEIKHSVKTLGKDEYFFKDKVVSAQSYHQLLISNNAVPVGQQNPFLLEKQEYGRFGLKVNDGQTQQIILRDYQHAAEAGAVDLYLSLYHEYATNITVTLECWIGEKISETAHYNRYHYCEHSSVHLSIPEASKGAVVVIYVKSEAGTVQVTDLKINGQFELVLPAGESVQEVDPLAKYKFHGQFNPPVDRYLFEHFFKNFEGPGFFIECGACDGVLDSSCLFFSETLGWQGINIEPTPYFYKKLQANRPGDRNLNLALSDTDGKSTFKLAIHPYWGRNCNNGSLSHAEHHTEQLVEMGCEFEEFEVITKRFADVVKAEKIKRIDLMVLDVEGHELAVLEGMKGAAVLPRVMCVEHGQIGLEVLTEAMEALGYHYVSESFVNSFWQR